MAALQALAAASLPQEVGSSAAQHLLQQATLQAEKVFQGQRFPVCLAEDATDMDDRLIWQYFMPLLDTILPASAQSLLQQDTSRALQGREDSMLDLGTELARALACLRLYFALQCQETAEEVWYSLSALAEVTAHLKLQQVPMCVRAACHSVRAACHSMHRRQDCYRQHLESAPFSTACCTACTEYFARCLK